MPGQPLYPPQRLLVAQGITGLEVVVSQQLGQGQRISRCLFRGFCRTHGDGRPLEFFRVATGLPTANNRDTLPERTDTVFSPRAAALYHCTDRVTAWGAVNSGLATPPRCTTPVAGSRTCIESQSTSTANARLLTNRLRAS